MSSVRKAERAMAEADSYAAWKLAAIERDHSLGLDGWRRTDESRRYDYALVRRRLDHLNRLRDEGDDHALLFMLNEGIHGNLGGMGRAGLYSKTAFGTKQLIVDYVDAIVDAIEHLASDAADAIPFEGKLDFFRRASHCFGRSALMMSGSGSLLFFHVGVVKALMQEGLLPSILSGSSGGALVAAVAGTRPSDEVHEAFEPEYFGTLIREGTGFDIAETRLRPKHVGNEHRRVILERLLPDLTFQEAYERSGLNINVSIAATELHQSSRLLNAITSPNVYIREAVLASTAVPGIYSPVTLAAKNIEGDRQPYLHDRRWVDGSLSDDLPAKRLSRLYGVNHYIVSQTNPHVLPFVTDAKLDQDAISVLMRTGQRTARELINGYAALIQKPVLSKNRALSQLVSSTLSIINQDYLGDINILPPTRVSNPFKLLSFRSAKEASALIEAGERATWPKMEMIRIQTKISRTLDRVLASYEDRLVKTSGLAPAGWHS